MPAEDQGLIHIEFRPGLENAIDALEIWSSTIRGYWTRICDYDLVRGEHGDRLMFYGPYKSAPLAEALEAIMLHQAMFHFDEPQHRAGLIQVYPPMAE